jgi:hypothetical protein
MDRVRLAGTISSRPPAAEATGAFYCATDEGLERDRGRALDRQGIRYPRVLCRRIREKRNARCQQKNQGKLFHIATAM